MATQLGYKYGEPQNERNKYHRTNKENYGSMCFDGNTLVATETGFKSIKDVVVGDKVFTHKGKLRKVTEVMKRYSDEVVKLHLSTQDVITTKSHPFYICSGRGKNFRFEKAENLKQSNDYCLTIPVIQLPNTDTLITNNNAFMLGYFLANGNIGYRSDMEKLTLTSGVNMSINAEYKDIYEKLFTNMGYDISYHQGRGNSAEYYIKSNELRDFIVKFGGFNYKELSHKYISKEVLNWNNEAKLELIRGFFAGDGQYGSSNGHLNMRFLNTNKSIIENLYLIIRSLGIHAKCFKYEREPRVIRR